MYHLTTFLGSFSETLAILITGFILININIKKYLILIISTGIYGGIFLTLFKEFLPPYLYLIIGFLTLGVVLTIFTRIHFIASLIAIISGGISLMIFELLVLTPITLLFGELSDKNSLMTLLISAPHILLSFGFAFLLSKNDFRIINVNNKKDNYFLLQSVFTILFSTLFLFYFLSTKYEQSQPSTIVYPLIFLAITLIIFILMNHIMKDQLRITEDRINSTYENEMVDLFRIVKAQRHDFIHHLSAVNGMLENNIYSGCKSYVNEILNSVESINEVLPIHSPAVAGLLLSYKHQAATKNITIQMSIKDDLKDIPCTVIETNQILGNLIKNAIEAVDSHSDQKYRYIEIQIENTIEDLIVAIINPGYISEEQIVKIFEYGYSSKANVQNEGSGLNTVQKIIESYNGTIYPEIKENLISIIVTFPKEKIKW